MKCSECEKEVPWATQSPYSEVVCEDCWRQIVAEGGKPGDTKENKNERRHNEDECPCSDGDPYCVCPSGDGCDRHGGQSLHPQSLRP